MNKALLIILVISLLLIAGCTIGSSGTRGAFTFGNFGTAKQSVDYHTGTDGILLNFLKDAPPKETYEGGEFDVQMYMENVGAFDIVGDYAIEWILFEDNSIVSKPELQSAISGSYIEKGQVIMLNGKSYVYPEGEGDFFAFDRFKANVIPGNFQEKEAKFYLSVCYPYRTYFSDEICIDTDIDGTDARPQVCHRKDTSYSRGQGAPIAITAVESLMVPRGIYVQPQFIIHVEHKGEGLISYYNETVYASGGCGPIDKRINESVVNKLHLEVSLGNDTLTCLPTIPFFIDGEMKIECILSEDKIYGMSSNYFTNLNVELHYLYAEQFDVGAKIIKSKLTNFKYEPLVGSDGLPPWELYNPATQETELRCDYCARTGGASSECGVSDLISPGVPKRFDSNYACVFTEEQCHERSLQDHCIIDKNLCPVDSYCGEPACSFDPKKNNKPRASFQVDIPVHTFSWYCIDSDDRKELLQTCGCTTTSYYAILDKSLSCSGVTSFKEVEGAYNKAMQRTKYTATIDNVNQELQKICVKVVDAQGVEVVKQYKFS